MENIIQPVPIELIEAELTRDKFIRTTNFGNNEIYSLNFNNSPNIMNEIGRLREISFREAGGGTGKPIDIDEFDVSENPYQQLIVWNPKDKEIIGGYRYLFCKNVSFKADGQPDLATTELFKFSEKFIKEYLPNLLELGRSFVQPKFQSTTAERKSLFSLDNLWDGLGALLVDHPDIKYFFGKVTMYRSYNSKARDYVLYYMKRYCPDKENLVYPIEPLPFFTDIKELDNIFNGETQEENYKILQQTLRELGENIPPLVNSYMNLSPTMISFGTSLNPHFGEVEETGIMVTVDDIYPNKKERHVVTYKKE